MANAKKKILVELSFGEIQNLNNVLLASIDRYKKLYADAKKKAEKDFYKNILRKHKDMYNSLWPIISEIIGTNASETKYKW